MKNKFKHLIFLFVLLVGCNSSQDQTSGELSGESTDTKPLIVFVTGDHEYSGETTLPLLAAELEKNYNMRTIVLKSYPDQNSEENIPGLEALKEADLAIFFLRWRRLPADQLAFIDDYLNSGKPVIGFRTSTHAFNYPEGHELYKWNAFGERAFGAPPGWGGAAKHTHYGHESSTDVSVIEKQADHPVLTGVDKAFHVKSWLYKVLPDYPAKGSIWLLMGKSVNPNTPDAIENTVAWTWESPSGAKTFMTTLGHPEDFQEEALQRIFINAVHWTLGKEVSDEWSGKVDINVPYRGIK
ncbi:MAG: ThuA domain-containing protein [Cyclobacteriaceae bacterium]